MQAIRRLLAASVPKAADCLGVTRTAIYREPQRIDVAPPRASDD